MTRAEVLAFTRRHVLAVQSSVSATGRPQAAVVGFVVTDAPEIFFDTDAASRKVVDFDQVPPEVVEFDQAQPAGSPDLEPPG